jgi:MoaA/NifB/PqqE/SkfB family radical SAM enzyme
MKSLSATAPPPARCERLYYYVTSACPQGCRHCYLGEQRKGEHVDLERAIATMARFRAAGAHTVVLLGGEPTLHPRYEDLVLAAAQLGFPRIVVDTSGLGRDPVPPRLARVPGLAIRFGFEGKDGGRHDRIRGPGSFARAFARLLGLVAASVRVEVTFTVTADNAGEIEAAVARFGRVGIAELNFHFLSRTGAARTTDLPLLDGDTVLAVERRLARLAADSPIPLRYPRLLLPQDELPRARAAGCGCRLRTGRATLVMPDGGMGHCPFELEREIEPPVEFAGCPAAEHLFPAGVPEGYVMTCISWKEPLSP